MSEASLTTIEAREVAVAAQPLPLDAILRAAQDPGTDIEKMGALLGLYERMKQSAAKEAFDNAMNACQSAMPTVTKNKAVINHKTGQTQSRYATFDRIQAIVKPIYQQFGFSVSFGTDGVENGKYIVTATVRNSGHTECYRIPLALDQSGAKNDTQGMGSTISYGQRYLLCMIFNIVIEGEDNDGAGAGASITKPQADSLRSRLDATGSNKDTFCRIFGVASLDDLPLAKLEDANRFLQEKERGGVRK